MIHVLVPLVNTKSMMVFMMAEKQLDPPLLAFSDDFVCYRSCVSSILGSLS